jgi:hypothetical protein
MSAASVGIDSSSIKLDEEAMGYYSKSIRVRISPDSLFFTDGGISRLINLGGLAPIRGMQTII